jgi:hypothetical protein
MLSGTREDWVAFLIIAWPQPLFFSSMSAGCRMSSTTKGHSSERMQQVFGLFSSVMLVAAGSQQYVAFDAASASSTHSVGNLAGSPTFAAQQALSAGSGYWSCLALYTALCCFDCRMCATGVPVVATRLARARRSEHRGYVHTACMQSLLLCWRWFAVCCPVALCQGVTWMGVMNSRRAALGCCGASFPQLRH